MVSRRWADVRPWQVFFRAEKFSRVNTAISFLVTMGAQTGYRVRDLLLKGILQQELPGHPRRQPKRHE
jgi:hypothetical protein